MAERRPILLATRSAGKLRELLPLFQSIGASAMTLDDAGLAESSQEEALEVFDTFEANALAKAEWFHVCAPHCVVVADDSGLAVDALGGAPGVRSKRWAGRSDLDGAALDAANNALLLQRLADVGANDLAMRAAKYVCAVAIVSSETRVVVRGETSGHVLTSARGAGGFGYDPLFLSADMGMTFAEATREAKSRVSHRGRAFALAMPHMAAAMALGRSQDVPR